jgi:MFS family permease
MVQPTARMRAIWRAGEAALGGWTGGLGNPEFRKLWIGGSVSLVGDQVTVLALPLTAVVFLSASSFEMGLLAALQAAPWLVVSLPAGAWADRLPRKRILIGANLGRAVLLAAIPISATLGLLRIEHLFIISALLGTLNVFNSVASQAFVPSLVSRGELVAANTSTQLSNSLVQASGLGLAGILVQRLGAPVALGVDAASFLVAALFIMWIKAPEAALATAARRAIAIEIVEGLRWLLRNPILQALVLNVANFAFASNMVSAIYVLYLTRELNLSPAVVGLIFAMRGLGSIFGALMVPLLASKLGTGRNLMCATGLGAAGLLVVPIADGPSAAPVLALGQFVFAMGSPLFNVNQGSLRQAITPDHLQGRISAGFRFIAQGPAPLGALLGGALGDAMGLRPAILAGAVCATIALVWLLASPVRRLEAIPTAPASN